MLTLHRAASFTSRAGQLSSNVRPHNTTMPLYRFIQFVLCAALLAASATSSAQRESDSIAPVVRCVQQGKFIVLEMGRLPETVTSRSVATLTGTKSITTRDGYRVILATSQGKPFINLKVELSLSSSAAADREAVEGQMQAFSSRRSPEQQELQRTITAGVEVLALHQPSLAKPGPLSFYSMFVSAKSIIATIYVLNQQPEERAFSKYSEYETLRDEAANLVRVCLVAG